MTLEYETFSAHDAPHRRCTLGTTDLHCGQVFELFDGRNWKSFRIELDRAEWILLRDGYASSAWNYDGMAARFFP